MSKVYSPFEMGRLVSLDKNRFVGQSALIAEQKRGHPREIVGLEIDWPEVEVLYEAVGLPPAVSPIASRVAVPVFKDGTQVGKATSSTWSPTLKKMIALATMKRAFCAPGTKVQFEITVGSGSSSRGSRVVEDSILQSQAEDNNSSVVEVDEHNVEVKVVG